jgi:DNA-binding response OmpR family regulator
MKAKILVVDDEPAIRRLLDLELSHEGYALYTSDGAETALEVLKREPIDLVIVDIIMPGIDGYSLCAMIREFSKQPIILLTAKGSVDDKIKGFDCGADDYITKPFDPRELSSRVKAVLQRSRYEPATPELSAFAAAGLEIDFLKWSVSVDGRPVDLTPTEFKLLKELVANRGKVLTHQELLNSVWGQEYQSEAQYLHVVVSHLRKKLGSDSKAASLIVTHSGVGYTFGA